MDEPPSPAGSPTGLSMSRRLWIVAAASALLFVPLAIVVVSHHPPFAADLAITRSLQGDAAPVEGLLRAVSWAGDDALWSTLLVVALGLAVFALVGWKEAVLFAGILAGAQGLKILVKQSVGRPRPQSDVVRVLIQPHEIDSFPSGHTVHYTALFGFLLYLSILHARPRAVRWALAGFCAFMILAVGVSRVYLGAHWASDILGGYLMGGAVLAAGIAIHQRVKEPPTK